MSYYQRACRGAASVLELGAGAGRIVTALAQPGRDVWGLELDPSLLALGRRAVQELAREERGSVKLVHGDMERFELPRRFERVILPYNGFFCLLSPRAARRCLQSVYAALEPRGVFSFDVWNAEGIHRAGLAPDTSAQVRLRIEHAGSTWQVFESCRAERGGSQRLDAVYRYVPLGRAQPREQLIRQRYYRAAELVALLEAAGFSLQTLAGTFSGAPFSDSSTRVIVSAIRP